LLRYPEYEIIGDEDISKTASISKRYSDQSLSGIITDIHFLSLSDYLVCTFSSQVIDKTDKNVKLKIINEIRLNYYIYRFVEWLMR
jgi:hypothetical protein